MHRLFLLCALLLALPTLNTASPGSNIAEVSIVAYHSIFNPNRHTLSLYWEISGCGERKLPACQSQGTLAGSTQCGPPNVAVDVYLNDASNKVLSYDPTYLPVDPIRGPLLIQDLISFRTEHELHPSYGNTVDSYGFRVFAFAIDPVTNLSLNITRFTVDDSLDGFTTASRSRLAPGVYVYGTGGGSSTVEIEHRVLEVEYRPPRSPEPPAMNAFVMCLVLTFGLAYVSLVAISKWRKDLAVIVLLTILLSWEMWLRRQKLAHTETLWEPIY
jgi:hypothetical protein